MEKKSARQNGRLSNCFTGCNGLILMVVIMWASLIPIGLLRALGENDRMDKTLAGVLQIGVLLILLAFMLFIAFRSVAFSSANITQHLNINPAYLTDFSPRSDDKSDFTEAKMMPEPKSTESKIADEGTRWLGIFLGLLFFGTLGAGLYLRSQGIRGGEFDRMMAGVICGFGLLLVVGLLVIFLKATQPVRAKASEIDVALAAKDFDKAIQLAEKAVEESPGNNTHVMAATVYLRAGQPERALTLLQKEALIMEQMSQMTAKNRRYYQRQLSEAQGFLGVALNSIGEYAEAEKLLEEAMRLDPQNELAAMNYAESLLYQRKPNKAIQDAIQRAEALGVKKKKPSKTSYFAARAWARAITGNRETAQQLIEEAHAVAQQSDNPSGLEGEVYYAEGMMYLVLGDTDQAQRAYHQSLSVAPVGLSAYLSKARLAELSA